MSIINVSGQKTLDGDYQFNRQELVSAFRFTKEGTFEFFFSYGASDRIAKGTYKIEGDSVKLFSEKTPGNDFSIDKQRKKGTGYTIHCNAPDKQHYLFIQCIAITNGATEVYDAQSDGTIQIEAAHCDRLYLTHSIFPDIPTLIKDENNENNEFTVTLLPSIQGISFKGITLKLEEDGTLNCLPNYLMMMENIRFRKQ